VIATDSAQAKAKGAYMASPVNDSELSTRAIMRLMLDVVRVKRVRGAHSCSVTALAKRARSGYAVTDEQTIA
jgi:hypothetical protein